MKTLEGQGAPMLLARRMANGTGWLGIGETGRALRMANGTGWLGIPNRTRRPLAE